MALVKLLDAERLAEGSVCEVIAQGLVLAVCHTSDGFWVVSGMCPHVGGPLGMGSLHGHALVCPWHGWEFDCTTGEGDFRGTLECYPVRVVEGEVMVELEEVSEARAGERM